MHSQLMDIQKLQQSSADVTKYWPTLVLPLVRWSADGQLEVVGMWHMHYKVLGLSQSCLWPCQSADGQPKVQQGLMLQSAWPTALQLQATPVS